MGKVSGPEREVRKLLHSIADMRDGKSTNASYLEGPQAGEVWRRPNSRGYGFVVSKPAETRHVIDRTLGSDVIFVSGRYSRNAYRQQCTLSEWLDWAHDAKLSPSANPKEIL